MTTKKKAAKNPPLGREGSISHLIRSLIAKGEPDEAILKKARSKFPKAAVADSYPGWYRAQMRRAGFSAAATTARAS